MSRTASSANEAGVSMDKLLGYIATVAEVTQKSASSVGESFKTIFARFGQIKAGKFIDSETNEDLSDVQKILAEFNIELYDTAGNMANVGDIIDTIASRWNTYNDVQKNALGTAIAGTRQRENFIVLMENSAKAIQYENVALNSAGTASQKYQAYINSVEAKQNELTATFEKFSQTLIDKGVIQGFYDLGIGALNFASALTKLLPVVKMLMFAGIGVGISKLIKQIPKLVSWVKDLGTGFKLLKHYGLQATQSETLLNAGITNTKLAAKGAAAASSALSIAISAVTTVIGLAIMAINAYTNSLEEKSRKELENFNEAKTQKRTIESLIGEYETLSKKAKLEDTDYDRLNQIQEELNKNIKDQKDKVDLVNGSYEEQKNKLDELSKKQLEIIERERKKALTTAEREITGFGGFMRMEKVGFSHLFKLFNSEIGLLSRSPEQSYEYYQTLLKKQDELLDKGKEHTKEYTKLENSIYIMEQYYGNYFQALEAVKELEEEETETKKKQTDANNRYNNSVQKTLDLSKQYQNTLSYATKLIDKQIKALQKEKEAIEEANKETQKQLDLYDKALAYINKTVDSKIKALEDEKKALSKKNDESERELKLQELRANLEKAKRNKIRAYSEERGWYWTEDLNAVAEAQKALEEEELSNTLDAQTDALNKQIEEWEAYKEALGTITTAYDDELSYQAFLKNQQYITEKGINAKDLTEVERFKNSYKAKQKQIDNNTTDSIDKRIKDFQNLKEEYESIAENFELSNLAQYAALTVGANYQNEILSGRLAKCKEFVKNYNAEMSKLETNNGGTYDTSNKYEEAKSFLTDKTKTSEQKAQKLKELLLDQDFVSATGYTIKDYVHLRKEIDSNKKSDFVKKLEKRAKEEKLRKQTSTNPTYVKSPLTSATGTKSSSQGMYNLNELGDELIVPPSQGNYQFLQKGTGVLNHGLTERLMTIAQNPYSYIKSSLAQMGISATPSQSNRIINIGTINLPQVHNANDFVRELQIITQNR